MQSITELAAARKAAYDLVENSADEKAAERHFKNGLTHRNQLAINPST
jgi:hypothetical protein